MSDLSRRNFLNQVGMGAASAAALAATGCASAGAGSQSAPTESAVNKSITGPYLNLIDRSEERRVGKECC